MDVLIRGLKNFFQQNAIIQVRRIPPTKTMRAHLFGLALALVGAFFTIIIDYDTLFGNSSWYLSLVAIGLFILGTYVGGLFVLFTMVLYFVPSSSAAFFSSFMVIAAWYFAFYAIGAIFSLMYNGFVFLDLITFGKNEVKIAFAYDPRKKINIIKSPIANEEKAFTDLLNLASTTEEKDELYYQKLYHFNLDSVPTRPYTIAFVANPKILRLGGEYESDPIITDLDLFLRAINNALYSLELDKVVGQRQIWSRIRVVSIFDDTKVGGDGKPLSDGSLSLIQDFYWSFETKQKVADVLSIPRPEIPTNVDDMLKRHEGDLTEGSLTVDDIDVIFVLSASRDLIRHTSYYSDFDESRTVQENPNPGTDFIYDTDPSAISALRKNSSIVPFDPDVDPFASSHDHKAHRPGRSAINVLSARRHTYIHEFAHAMSSALRGAICDEYYDESFLVMQGGLRFKPFYVNRIERVPDMTKTGKFVPIHQIFAKYNDEIYLSDVAHPSATEEWMSYFPERENGKTCTMDRTAEPFEFDKLIRRFIYDRLITKLNR